MTKYLNLLVSLFVLTAASSLHAQEKIHIASASPKTSEVVTGHVAGISDPTRYKVAVYIYVPDWGWVSAGSDYLHPFTSILADNSWMVDAVGPETDSNATRVAAFILPASAPAEKYGLQQHNHPTLPPDFYKHPNHEVKVDGPADAVDGVDS